MAKPRAPADPTTCSFRIASPCGRVFRVPWLNVREDYLRFLRKEDGLTRTQALAQMAPDDVTAWFYEQFDWSDVDRMGVIAQPANAAQVREALNLMRSSQQPSDRAVLEPDGPLVAAQRAKRLDKALPAAPAVRSRRPRL